MRNNHFFKTQILLAALAAAIIAPICAFAQQKPAARTTTIKDSDIYVPDSVLEPPYTKKEASDLLKKYVAAFSDTDMPRSYEVFAKNPEKYKRIGSRQIESALVNLYNYIFETTVKADGSTQSGVSPDLMEVTQASEAWFKSLYNKALELNEPAALMDKAIRQRNASMYTQAQKGYAEKIDALKSFIEKKPERLSSEQLKKLSEANKARRKKAYIEMRKQYLLDQEAAAQQALDELEKKSSSSKKK